MFTRVDSMFSCHKMGFVFLMYHFGHCISTTNKSFMIGFCEVHLCMFYCSIVNCIVEDFNRSFHFINMFALFICVKDRYLQAEIVCWHDCWSRKLCSTIRKDNSCSFLKKWEERYWKRMISNGLRLCHKEISSMEFIQKTLDRSLETYECLSDKAHDC